jgi:hypothetical protein
MRRIIIGAFLSILSLTAFSQNEASSICGTVTDTIGNPIADLTVFVPFTSKGTTTNAKGEYCLTGLPEGNVDVVFRHVSYLPADRSIFLNANANYRLDMQLQGSVIELSEIIKKADQANWKLGWEKFSEYVLGDPLGRYCKVKNPKDLFFYFDGEKLTGHATKPIEIENNYLGYTQKYFLDYFWFQEGKLLPDDPAPSNTYAFSGASFYIDRIDENWLRKGVWEKNRNNEFKGSLRHFLLALFYDQLADQGYLVREVYTDAEDLQRSENISQSVAYVRFLQMRKVFFYDQEQKKSYYLHYFPAEDYPLSSKITDLKQVPPSYRVQVEVPLLIFYFRNSSDELKDARIAYLDIQTNESKEPAYLFIDDQGNSKTNVGELVWKYLDNQTHLVMALPMDYLPRK